MLTETLPQQRPQRKRNYQSRVHALTVALNGMPGVFHVSSFSGKDDWQASFWLLHNSVGWSSLETITKAVESVRSNGGDVQLVACHDRGGLLFRIQGSTSTHPRLVANEIERATPTT